MFNNYAIVQGVDQIVPVDVYAPGCPPGPETLIHAISHPARAHPHRRAVTDEAAGRRPAGGAGATRLRRASATARAGRRRQRVGKPLTDGGDRGAATRDGRLTDAERGRARAGPRLRSAVTGDLAARPVLHPTAEQYVALVQAAARRGLRCMCVDVCRRRPPRSTAPASLPERRRAPALRGRRAC